MEMEVVREFDADSRDGRKEDSPGSRKLHLNFEYFGGGRSPSQSASRKVSTSLFSPRWGTFGVVVAARRRRRDDLAVCLRRLEAGCGGDCGSSGMGSDVAIGTSRSDVVRQLSVSGSVHAGIMRL